MLLRALYSHRTRLVAALAVGFVALACAPMPGPGSPSTSSNERARSNVIDIKALSESRMLTPAQLDGPNIMSTTDAIMRFHPEFLRGSGRVPQANRSQVGVYLDEHFAGDTSVLNTIPLNVIRRIEFVHPIDAMTRFGLMCRCEGGAILVSTRERR